MSFNLTPEHDLDDIQDVNRSSHFVYSNSASDEEADNKDPFDPFVPLEGTHGGSVNNIVTLRAILVGILCGALANASNIYLGLRAGWTTSANILGVCPVCAPYQSCN
jgi:hypothetical protein